METPYSRAERRDQRDALRLDCLFPVFVESAFGDVLCVARNVSTGGMFVETRDPLPLGTPVRVHFAMPGSEAEIVARGEVKNQYFLQFDVPAGPRGLTGVGIRFSAFEQDGESTLSRSLYRTRLLH